MQGKQQLCILLLYESLVGQCEYTTQPKGSFWCHVIDAKDAVLSLIFINKFVLVLYLSFSFRYVVELTLWRSPCEKSCTQKRWVFIEFPLIITNFYMIDLHKNVCNMLVNQKTGFISSRNWENIGKKEVKAIRNS